MGAWGIAIFSDDLACDVRDTYRDLVGEGLSPQEATKQTLDEFEPALRDPEDGPVAWLALAVTQWKVGRLQDDVRVQALRVIDSGENVARWEHESSALAKRRVLVLEKVRSQLLSPQRAPVAIRKHTRATTPFVPGDVVSYIHDSGNLVALWVYGNHVDRGGTYSEVQVCAAGLDLPALDKIVGAETPRFRVRGGMRAIDLMVVDCQYMPTKRWHLLGNRPWPANRTHGGAVVTRFRQGRGEGRRQFTLDGHLDACF